MRLHGFPTRRTTWRGWWRLQSWRCRRRSDRHTRPQPPLVKKEEAFAVLQKAVDFDGTMRKATLGKSAFDEHAKKKAQASTNITLVEHPIFMEGVLRVHAGALSPEVFLRWLAESGVSELGRLEGKPTFTAR